MSDGRTTFAAPWGRELKLMSVSGAAMLALPAIIATRRGAVAVGIVLVAVLMIVACQIVRSYEVRPRLLLIRRPFWTTRWPLDARSEASAQPGVMRGAWRTWGNGGLFSFSGHFAGHPLGRYYALVTDLSRTVVITTPRGPLVVSPDDPAAFVSAIWRVTHTGMDGTQTTTT